MDNASGAGKKTIQPQDVLVALKDTEFEFMIPRIEAELKSTFKMLTLHLFFLYSFGFSSLYHTRISSSWKRERSPMIP